MKKGVNPDHRDVHGITVLGVACELGGCGRSPGESAFGVSGWKARGGSPNEGGRSEGRLLEVAIEGVRRSRCLLGGLRDRGQST